MGTLIVDLKDCFFTIPLHPDDTPKFAFTVPYINHAPPVEREQWKGNATGNEKQYHNLPVVCCTGTLNSEKTVSTGILLSLYE